MIDGAFTDQVFYDLRALKVKDDKAHKACKRIVNLIGVRRYIIMGSKAWNERYLKYEWNEYEFGKKRKQSLPEFMNTVEKRREDRQNKFFTLFNHKVAEGRLSDVIQSSLGYTLTYNHTMEGNMYKEQMNEKRTRRAFASTRTIMKEEYGYVFHMRRMKRKWNNWIWWWMILVSSMKWWSSIFWMASVIISIVSSQSWHAIWCWAVTMNSRYSFSPMIDEIIFVSFTRITSMISLMGIWSGREMPWKYRRRKKMDMSTMDESNSISRCYHCECSWVTNTPHLPSLDNQLSIPISMTTGDYNGVSFWQVEVDTRLLQIVRWVMEVCSTSGGNNPTSTRCSE